MSGGTAAACGAAGERTLHRRPRRSRTVLDTRLRGRRCRVSAPPAPQALTSRGNRSLQHTAAANSADSATAAGLSCAARFLLPSPLGACHETLFLPANFAFHEVRSVSGVGLPSFACCPSWKAQADPQSGHQAALSSPVLLVRKEAMSVRIRLSRVARVFGFRVCRAPLSMSEPEPLTCRHCPPTSTSGLPPSSLALPNFFIPSPKERAMNSSAFLLHSIEVLDRSDSSPDRQPRCFPHTLCLSALGQVWS